MSKNIKNVLMILIVGVLTIVLIHISYLKKQEELKINNKYSFITNIKDNWLNFDKAKKILEKEIYNNINEKRIDLYCWCEYDFKKDINLNSCWFISQTKSNKRSKKIEWEHIVPAENFWKWFKEWRESWREWAKKNKDFNIMEWDMYNLFPVNWEVNWLRSNYKYSVVQTPKYSSFWKCDFKIDVKWKLAEPRNQIKWLVARVNLYMWLQYSKYYNISDQQRKLFEAWDKMYPVTKGECNRYKQVKVYQKNNNTILEEACKNIK